MAYSFNRTPVLQRLTAPLSINATPMTVSFWFKLTNATTNGTFISIEAASGHRNSVGWNGTARVQSTTIGPAAGAQITPSSPSIQSNQWFNVCAVFQSIDSRLLYWMGATNSNTVNIGIQNNFTSLIILKNSDTQPVEIAEVGVWSDALTSSEALSLQGGMTCDKIRPQSLRFYAPLIRDLLDIKNGLTITNNNGATIATNPRVYA